MKQLYNQSLWTLCFVSVYHWRTNTGCRQMWVSQQSQESGKKTKSSIEQNLSSPLARVHVSRPTCRFRNLMTLDDSAGPSCAEPVHTCSTSESSDVFRLLSASAAFLAIPGVALSLHTQKRVKGKTETPKSAPREPTAAGSGAMDSVKRCRFPW